MHAPDVVETPRVAKGIYGQIIVTSLVAALSLDEGLGPRGILIGVVGTVLVYWLAHVYADGIAAQLVRPGGVTRRAIREILGEDWSIVMAAVPTAVILGLGWIGVLPEETAIDLAIGVGVATLFGLGLLVGRRLGLTPLATLGSAALNGTFGLVIVGLKIAVI